MPDREEMKANVQAKLSELQTRFADIKAKAANSPIAADVQAVGDAVETLVADVRQVLSQDDADTA